MNTIGPFKAGRWCERNAHRIETWKRGLYRFRKSRLSVGGGVIIAFIVMIAVLGPYLAPYPDDAKGSVHVSERFEPPSPAHLFGTDEMGRDVFSLVMAGARVSLSVGVVVLGVAVTVGTVLGAIAGYFGGPINEVIMRITDIFLSVPSLVLAIAIAATLGRSIQTSMLAIGLVWWPGYCRLVRAEVSSRKHELYTQAARALGAGNGRIIFVHILPNVASPLVIRMSLDMGFAILTAAALGFVGVGAQPPVPEWGAMLSVARRYMPGQWWYPVFPGLALFFTVFGFNLLGDGMRDVLDPRARR